MASKILIAAGVVFILLACALVSAVVTSKDSTLKGITERAMLAKESYDFHKAIFSEKYNLIYSNGRRYTLQQYLTLKGVEVR